MNMLQFTKFQKLYGSFPVLKIDDLQLPTGIFWIKGANGAGKSTLLRAVAGVIDFEGDILLGGHISLKKQPTQYRKLVNFAEAEPVFPAFLTGKEMLKLFTSAKEAPKGQEDYFIESMQMNTYLNEPLGTYSSGMLKKLSIVLAFIGNPKIILLDEPLNTIDNESLKIIYEWIKRKNQQEKISFLLSSHQTLPMDDLNITHELLIDQQTIELNHS